MDDLGTRIPAGRVSPALSGAVLKLFAASGLNEVLTVAMLDSMAVLATSSPERLALALEAWAKRASDLKAAGGSSQITVAHNVCRGQMGGLEVSTTLKF